MAAKQPELSALPSALQSMPAPPEGIVNWMQEGPVQLVDDSIFTLDGSVRTLLMGLGWDAGCDVDGSVALYDWAGNHVESVNYTQLTSKCGAVSHSGDDRTGEGGGDDEVITIDLDKIPFKVAQIMACVTVFTIGTDFSMVKSCYVRLLHGDPKHSGKELCHYPLSGKPGNAVVLCTLTRQGAWWVFKALGTPSHGRCVAHVVSDPNTPLLLGALPKVPPVVRRVYVAVVEGKGLVAKDKNVFKANSSDPYYTIKYSGTTGGRKTKVEYKSDVIQESLTPQWPEVLVDLGYVIASDSKPVKITVYDKDTLSEDDFMGQVRVPAATLFNRPTGQHEFWFELKPCEKIKANARVSGSLLIRWQIEDIPFENLLKI